MTPQPCLAYHWSSASTSTPTSQPRSFPTETKPGKSIVGGGIRLSTRRCCQRPGSSPSLCRHWPRHAPRCERRRSSPSRTSIPSWQSRSTIVDGASGVTATG
ncbi:hypothetical protein BU23DRAFT_47411 [Bimuria novae-zelandiae CBS 107.79]|uniref:Uncharacterized protein n=1 Tax=Bimuria novae-zelandiae CBS 107.79 TaxID=1447943 RepID=A0A6A5VGU6_9PLEO|nr:hypothetical protein BU23DRAFT_47411 [Bimuria novae-zelandiae CBS 107.79]